MDGRLALARLPPITDGNLHQPFSPGYGSKYDGFGGPSYQLHDNKYQLPAPNKLKPYVDTKAGELDTWPAHATDNATSSMSVVLSKNKHLLVLNDEDQGKVQIVPKPRFLDQLENFLKKELRSLGVTDVAPNELRLQAHREVFEYLIEDFKTYKPLLSAIKNEYEMMLAYQRQQIRELEPLKQMLVTVSEQCDHKVMQIRDQEKQEIVELKAVNKELRLHIEGMRNAQRDLATQVEKLQEELAAEYLRYRDECDSRKLLLADINDLRYQQDDLLASKQSMKDLEEEEDDPVTLRIALRKAREDEKYASVRLNEMIANYGDVIPRREFEMLEQNFIQLDEKYAAANEDFTNLKGDHESLLAVHKQVVAQRDEFYKESETMRRSSTPRPRWERCADHVQGGGLRWKELAEGKTSDELVDVLLTEMSSGSGGVMPDSGGAEFFEGQGTDESVPPYLRFEGQIRNRRLGKRDCSLLIRDIWREKASHDQEREDGTRDNMASFLHLYLQRRFALEPMVAEWGYNLFDACKRYSHEENIGMFLGILTQEIDEERYHSELQTVERLLIVMTKLDMENGNLEKLTKSDFKSVLQDFFKHSEDNAELDTLMNAAEAEVDTKETGEMEYKNLFMVDDEGKAGPFMDEVKILLRKGRQSYFESIKSQLSDTSSVEVDDLKRAFTMADPEIDAVTLDRYLVWCFNMDIEALKEAEPIELPRLLERLHNGNIMRMAQMNDALLS